MLVTAIALRPCSARASPPPGAGVPAAGFVRDDPRMAEADQLRVTAPFAGVVVAIRHGVQEHVAAASTLVVLEAMKMEHEVPAGADGTVHALAVSVGDAVEEGQLLAMLAPGAGAQHDGAVTPERSPAGERSDLAAVRARHASGLVRS